MATSTKITVTHKTYRDGLPYRELAPGSLFTRQWGGHGVYLKLRDVFSDTDKYRFNSFMLGLPFGGHDVGAEDIVYPVNVEMQLTPAF